VIHQRPPRTEPLPFCRPTIEDDDVAEVVACLRSGWITTGPRTARFEEIFRERLGAPHALAVTSATAGLHLLLAAMDVGPGDEVIVPAITWPSTANVVELLGARTVFADVDRDTLQIDPDDVARRVTERTRAIMPVHFAGAPADLRALREIAEPRGIPVIEDAAHALGTEHRGVEVGADSFAAVFSFHPIKNATTGEGGMIVCRDDRLAERLRLLRFHGVRRDAWKRYAGGGSPGYDVEEPGYKHNLPDLLSALGLTQMAKLDAMNAARAERAARYDELLAGIDGIRPIGRVPYPSRHAWHLYVVRADRRRLGIGRDDVIAALGEEKIAAGLHFPAVHLLTYYRERYGHRPGDLPSAEAAGAEILSLPLYPSLTAADQEDVAAALARVARRAAPTRRPQPALAS
jgi:UDP-4-amino-4-deoxy-L-arabinose-oxoglutarate aminotransferase